MSNKNTISIRVWGSESVKKADIPTVLDGTANIHVLAQAIHTGRSRKRILRAHTKDRSEVRGGGKKPWKQKGTGRARHASIRSPLWVGGGTTFGPRSRKTVKKRVAKGLRLEALRSALYMHAVGGTLTVIQFSDITPKKTSDASSVFAGKTSVLFILDNKNEQVQRAIRNIRGVQVVRADQVEAQHVVGVHEVWIEEPALATLEKRIK